MENLKIFEYKGMPISFVSEDGEPMINATEMATAFCKEIKKWFQNQSTYEYIEEYARVKRIEPMGKIPPSLTTSTLARRYPSLIKVVRGGLVDTRKQGTFLCRGLSIEFARWLNPVFAVWCDERISEYLNHGITATPDVLHQMQTDPEFARRIADELVAERARSRALAEHNRQLESEAQENAPKVSFYDSITTLEKNHNKRKTFLISKIAKEFEMKAQPLNKFLIRKRVIVRVENGYAVHPQYQDEDIAYARIVHKCLYDGDGELISPNQQCLEYTKKGREVIIKLLEEERLKKAEQKS